MFDEHHLIAFESEFCCAVVGRGREYVLISVTTVGPIDEALCEQAEAQQFSYCGIIAIAIIGGQTRAKCLDAASLETMVVAAREFRQSEVRRIDHIDLAKRALGNGDWLSWISRL